MAGMASKDQSDVGIKSMHRWICSYDTMLGVKNFENFHIIHSLWGISLPILSVTNKLFCRQPWCQKTMPDMASGFHNSDLSMPYLAPYFDATAGVKKLVCYTQNG